MRAKALLHMIAKSMDTSVKRSNRVDIVEIQLSYKDYMTFKMEIKVTREPIDINKVPLSWAHDVPNGSVRLLRSTVAGLTLAEVVRI